MASVRGRRTSYVASIAMIVVAAFGAVVAWWGAATSAVLTLLYFVQRIPPPMISMAVVTVLYPIAARASASRYSVADR